MLIGAAVAQFDAYAICYSFSKTEMKGVLVYKNSEIDGYVGLRF